jgi:hypothetical protein
MELLPVIHMFWHGPALSRVERLCMASFMAHGHRVHLHVYEQPQGVPLGVYVVDASNVLPERQLFRHPKTGSMAMFADWFRYCVLYAQGGVWADTDVVCLQALVYGDPEIYAWEDERQINNAVLGLPAGSALALWMAQCCENPNRILPYDDGRSKRRKWRRRFLEGNRRANVKWGEFGPVGFTAAARHFGLAAKALPPWHFYPIHYRGWQDIFTSASGDLSALLGQSRALHLWNEMMRREPGFDKNARFPANSPFEQLCSRFLGDDRNQRR